MEEVIKIEGKHALEGTVRISGSKNATVALIPAAILANGPVTICGVPEISDVQSLSVLLRDLGVLVDIRSSDTIVIDPTAMENRPLVQDAVNKLRASYYFMGALLGKYGHAEIKMPGGCYLGPRPIDLHLKGFEALGAEIRYDHGSYILDAPQLIGTKIFLDIASVGATINIMMAAVHAKGRTTIENAAKEPEIIDVATLLNKWEPISAVRVQTSSRLMAWISWPAVSMRLFRIESRQPPISCLPQLPQRKYASTILSRIIWRHYFPN